MSEEYNEWYWKLYRWFKWEFKYQHKYIKYGVQNLQNESYYDEFYELDKRSSEALKIVIDKHNKAKRLLFKILNDKIEDFWN